LGLEHDGTIQRHEKRENKRHDKTEQKKVKKRNRRKLKPEEHFGWNMIQRQF
jgi:hypothetical protein